jgi:two-component system, chemotaxis family, sensor kinase CheA
VDVSDYLPMFLAEGREHLQTLNLSLVRIEQDPQDGETINDIFRVAHTLKGMSATMGFSRMASLTHEMESVMEGMRGRADGLHRDALNCLFGCLDTLERMVDEIEQDGAEQSDPATLISALQGLLAAGPSRATTAALAPPTTTAAAADQPTTSHEPADQDDDAPSPDVVRAVERSGLWCARVLFRLDEATDMPGVRAYLAVRKAEDHGELVGSRPPIDVIEKGEIDATADLVIWVATADERDAIAEAILAQDGVATVAVSRVGVTAAAQPPAGAAPQPAAAGSPHADTAQADTQPAAQRPAKAKTQTVRVEAERLDLLMHMMGEMVVQRTRLEALAQHAGQGELQSAVNDLSRVAQSLQQMVMQVRMVPVESVFMRFPRMVRDLASKLGKQVDLQIKGESTELDRTVVEALGDPLVHLVRNAMDHGLEPPAERLEAGKPATGVLEISAEHAGGEVLIRVREDGRGVDPAKIGAIATARGLISVEEVDGLTVEGAVELLFEPGFSTAEATTDISGRGVGMDAVRTMVRNLGGDCFVQSATGHGSTATIRLPLSLAILPALLVGSNGSPYALPLERVEQTIRISDYALRSIAGAYAIVLRDAVLPLYDLGAILGGPSIAPSTAAAVVCRAGTSRIGLLVSELVGQQELVTRPLPAVTNAKRSLVSGGAVLGNGQIALIVDLDAVAKQVKAAA